MTRPDAVRLRDCLCLSTLIVYGGFCQQSASSRRCTLGALTYLGMYTVHDNKKPFVCILFWHSTMTTVCYFQSERAPSFDIAHLSENLKYSLHPSATLFFCGLFCIFFCSCVLRSSVFLLLVCLFWVSKVLILFLPSSLLCCRRLPFCDRFTDYVVFEAIVPFFACVPLFSPCCRSVISTRLDWKFCRRCPGRPFPSWRLPSPLGYPDSTCTQGIRSYLYVLVLGFFLDVFFLPQLL